MKNVTAVAALVTLAGVAQAAPFSVVTNEAQTILSTGPRSGGSQPFFHNVQGSGSPAQFRSFAATDYNMAGVTDGNLIDDLDSLTFSIQQSNAFFTNNGSLRFYVATADNAMSSLAYAGDDLLANPGGLNNIAFIGTGVFNEVSNGFQNDYTFDFDGALDGSAAEQLIENAILNGTELRWVISAGDSGTAATWGGIGNFDTSINPTISGDFTLVPAPGAFAVAGFAGLAAARRRRA